jgi:GntR family transcriptional regulator/MocR family aminotransferase
MFPALRLGYAIVPEPLRAGLLELRSVADGFGAPASQLALADFIGEGHLHRHIRRMQRLYAQRRSALLTAMHERLKHRLAVLPAKAGLHFAFQLLQPVDWHRVTARAAELQMAFERCSRYAIDSRIDLYGAIGFGLLQDEQIGPVVDRLQDVFS